MAVYRPKYRDPKTGELVESEIWWCNFRFAGKRYRESTESPRKTVAVEFEKRRRLELEKQYAGIPTEQPGKARIRTVSEALKAYQKAYAVNHREKSRAWVEERGAHVDRLLGSVVLMDLTEDRIRGYMEARLDREGRQPHRQHGSGLSGARDRAPVAGTVAEGEAARRKPRRGPRRIRRRGTPAT